ncbi:MAG: thioredoxin family protein, partial [Proteobacteria bacterium]|nr:thioredoxin family protein [Burkholderiales bacterium]
SRGATNAIPGASALPDAGPAAGPGSGIGLALALLLAVAGGLILNLMPCVFPVLSIKALAMLDQSAREPRALRMDGLAFAAGVMVSFWALAGTLLALRAGGEQIGWGFQLQSPPFIAAMAVLFTLLALNLAGVFELGSSVASAAGGVRERSGRTGAFLTGVLAVAIAAPCTAPFMGAALGYALAQPAVVALAVFSALALGMALPYVLLSFAPGLARVLPRPGPWMVAFKQAMVFPLLGTVAWLTWVLGIQSGNNAVFGLLAGLVLVSFAAWIYGHFATRAAGRGARVSAGAFTVVFALAGMYVAWPSMDVVPAEQSTRNRIGALEWEPWSVERVEALRAEGRPVFIDFTAAWCVTCQVNKQLVLDTGAVVARLTERNVATLRADWTRRDRAITEALAGYGRSGVPVYALYLPGRAQPILLPELLTREIVLAALDRTDSDSVASTR